MGSQAELSQIENLVNQWQALAGYPSSITPAQLDLATKSMAAHPEWYQSLFDVGQFMNTHVFNTGTAYGNGLSMPWATFGLSHTQYDIQVGALQDMWTQLTGQAFGTAPPTILANAIGAYQGSMTASQFRDWLMVYPNFANTYGWVKYGLDYQQFSQQKLQMQQSLGYMPTDQQAVVQLQYMHAAQGSNASVATAPTFTQQEKQQVQAGVSGSVVR